MTGFDKRVRRVTRGAYSTLYRKPRKIVVELAPGDLLVFREQGRRQRWTLNADTAFRYAVRMQAFADAAEKRLRRKKGGKR